MVWTPSATPRRFAHRSEAKSRTWPAHGWRVLKTLLKRSPSIANQSSSWMNPLLPGKSSAWTRTGGSRNPAATLQTKSHCMTGRTLAEMHRRRSEAPGLTPGGWSSPGAVAAGRSGSGSPPALAGSARNSTHCRRPRPPGRRLVQELHVRSVVGRLLLHAKPSTPTRRCAVVIGKAHKLLTRTTLLVPGIAATCFLGQVRNDEGLLGLHDPPCQMVFHGISGRSWIGVDSAVSRMCQRTVLLRGVVQVQGQKIESA